VNIINYHHKKQPHTGKKRFEAFTFFNIFSPLEKRMKKIFPKIRNVYNLARNRFDNRSFNTN